MRQGLVLLVVLIIESMIEVDRRREIETNAVTRVANEENEADNDSNSASNDRVDTGDPDAAACSGISTRL